MTATKFEQLGLKEESGKKRTLNTNRSPKATILSDSRSSSIQKNQATIVGQEKDFLKKIEKQINYKSMRVYNHKDYKEFRTPNSLTKLLFVISFPLSYTTVRKINSEASDQVAAALEL